VASPLISGVRRLPLKTSKKVWRHIPHDLLEELDRELADVYPEATYLLYYFLDTPAVLSGARLNAILYEAGINSDAHEKVVDFLL
jgi:hypothetical protein